MNTQVILITGATSGIGKATAKALLKKRHTVYVSGRNIDDLDELVELGGKALELDVTQSESIQKAIKTITDEQNGVIDVLVNNAGYGLFGAVEDISLQDARAQFDVNLFGLAAVTKEVLPYMRSKKAGTIINISSMAGKMYTPLGAWYHASKHALEGWSDCLRIELKQFGIKVVVIEPGIIKTNFGKTAGKSMVQRAGDGPYKSYTEKVAAGLKQMYGSNTGTPASEIGTLIATIVSSKKTKTRYVKGVLAKPSIFIRKWCGDRFFDWLLAKQLQ